MVPAWPRPNPRTRTKKSLLGENLNLFSFSSPQRKGCCFLSLSLLHFFFSTEMLKIALLLLRHDPGGRLRARARLRAPARARPRRREERGGTGGGREASILLSLFYPKVSGPWKWKGKTGLGWAHEEGQKNRQIVIGQLFFLLEKPT